LNVDSWRSAWERHTRTTGQWHGPSVRRRS